MNRKITIEILVTTDDIYNHKFYNARVTSDKIVTEKTRSNFYKDCFNHPTNSSKLEWVLEQIEGYILKKKEE